MKSNEENPKIKEYEERISKLETNIDFLTKLLEHLDQKLDQLTKNK